jgi:hypothetical protein
MRRAFDIMLLDRIFDLRDAVRSVIDSVISDATRRNVDFDLVAEGMICEHQLPVLSSSVMGTTSTVKTFAFKLLAHVLAAGDDGPPIGQALSTQIWTEAYARFRDWLIRIN